MTFEKKFQIINIKKLDYVEDFQVDQLLCIIESIWNNVENYFSNMLRNKAGENILLFVIHIERFWIQFWSFTPESDEKITSE